MDTACSGKEETKGMLLSTLAATCKMGNVDLSKNGRPNQIEK